MAFTEHEYRYAERGGTAVSSRALGVPEHMVIKTLVMEDDQKRPLIVLMHGDKEVSTKNLARQIGSKTVSPCAPDAAQKPPATWWAGPRRLARASRCRFTSSDRSRISSGFTSTAVAAGF